LTFDIFGTVLDWRSGLRDALARIGKTLEDAEFDRVIDAQGADEAGEFRSYTEIVARSLTSVLGLAPEAALAIGREAGRWPLFPDSREALRDLVELVPCAALTNSDRAHGEDVQGQLGFRLSDWYCAEESRVYKPAAAFWSSFARRRGLAFDARWWHVSAYGDYDLETARALGLTCVFVLRPHARPGPADVTVGDLRELVALVKRAS
jgi:2-haloalkanoic acid dehalogenase type II